VLLTQFVLVRHGDTVGESRIRFHGAGDVALSDAGFRQAREARVALPGDHFDRIVSSTLMRAWQTAFVLARGRPVQLEHDFREIHFGRWEGLTREEIMRRDPVLYADWQQGGDDFVFPEGEARLDFRHRVERGLERLMARGDTESAIVVAHKGVVRTLEVLAGERLDAESPRLGGMECVSRGSDGRWRRVSLAAGRHARVAQPSSDSRSEASTL